MSLKDLNDRDAVLAALREFDRLGREAFLSHYGFGRAREYYVEHQGKQYDSKAIAGAAHGHQHGRPLQSGEFSGGEETVQRVLGSLGFHVVRQEPAATGDSWTFAVGDVTLRRDISKRYGGSLYGGIEPSARTPNIFLFTDPAAGAQHGYNYDGWEDGHQDVFYYTGEGPVGDQQEKGGNLAILRHKRAGRTLRLFEAITVPKGTGGAKPQGYLGEFRLDDAAPYRRETAPDQNGDQRTVMVFRLVRVPDSSVASAGHGPSTGAPSAASAVDVPVTPHVQGTTPTAHPTSSSPSVTEIDSEDNRVFEWERAPRSGASVQRHEARMVADFEGSLRSRGHTVRRFRIQVPTEPGSLVTDCCDLTEGVLYEAKSSTDRATIRLGVGQLLDYLRFLPGMAGTLLLPARPSADLVHFVASAGIGLTHQDGDGTWTQLAAPVEGRGLARTTEPEQ